MKVLFLFFALIFVATTYAQQKPEIKIPDVGIYPNPFNEQIFVKSENKVEKIEIYNTSGQLVLSINQTNIVDATELRNGTYVLKAYYEDQIIVTKVLKK